MLVIHHNDLDGRAAAAVVAYTYTCFHQEHQEDIRYHEIAYKDDFPFHLISSQEKVVIVDFSLQRPGEWEKLLEITSDVVWIDHHITAIEKEGPQRQLRGLRSTDGSGASLAWKYYQSESTIPRAIVLVADWDTWTHAFGKETLDFVAGMGIENTHPASPLWINLFGGMFDDMLGEIIERGSVVNQYKNQSNKEYLNTFGFETTLDGYSVLAANKGKISSLLFGDKIKEYDIVSSFVFDGKLFTVSLYSEKIHVGNLAQKYGGGGHPGAAGFQCKELPYRKQ